ncbi:MAG: serine hydrolase domain-containing protein [Bacteroidota bacterium]
MRITILLFFTLLFANTAPAQLAVTAVIDSLDAYLQEKKIPGAMISIVRGDTVLFEGGIGYANVEVQEEVTAQHLFRLGSISKSMTALGLLHLLHEHNISLQTPIKDIAPDLPITNPWAAETPIAIEHILEHTAGFEDMHLHAGYYDNEDTTTKPPMGEFVERHANSLTARWRPGERTAYSNPDYIIAGHLIEKISGQAYHQYIQQHLFEPLGMSTSGYYFRSPDTPLMAQGYNRQGGTFIPVPFTTITGGPSGGFCSSAADMSKYLQFMLNRGATTTDSTLFTKALFDRIEHPETTIAAKKGLPYGYGLGNYSVWKNGYLFHGHSGGIDGFMSRYLYSRAADLGIAISINRQGDANAFIDEILRLLLGEPDAPKRTIQPIPETLKETYAHFYEFDCPRHELLGFTDKMLAGLTLDFQGDKVITRTLLGKAEDTLYYAGNQQFYFNNEGIPTVLLFQTTDNKNGLWINNSYTVEASRGLRVFKFIGLVLSTLLLFSFLLYTLIWLTIRLIKKRKIGMPSRFILFGAGAVFISLFIAFGNIAADRGLSGTFNFSSIYLYIASYLFCLLSAATVYYWFHLSSRKGFRMYYICCSIGAIALSIYLYHIGFVGLRLWDY